MHISDLSTLAEAFLEYLKNIRGYSPKTIQTYKGSLLEILELSKLTTDEGILTLNIIPFRQSIITQDKKTISKKLSSLRSFKEYLEDREVTLKIVGDSKIKYPKTLPKPINTNIIMSAMSECDTKEKLLISIIYGLGLRISEASNLKLEDIKDSWVRVLGKGSKTREIYLLKEIEQNLRDYIAIYSPTTYIFEENGKKLSEKTLRLELKKVFERVGINATPHQLRHSFATDLINNGAGILNVKELLGHSSLSTTEIYTKLSSSAKLKSYLNSHPLCDKEDNSGTV